MGSDKVPLLLVTANVGSIFEDPSVMLPIWTSEFLQAVSRMDPKFIALHLQEVGGKAYERSMQYVQDFVQRLCDCPELRLFDKVRIFLDEDFSSPEKFTALGNMYFAHSTLTDIKIWDFDAKSYVDVVGKEINSGNIEKVTTKEKAKFPQHFFPECKWSRKGFLRTRWFLRGTAVEFVNIHLFHDASNLLAMESFPSVYCRSRRRALRHTLRHLHSDANGAPYFIFGDFNFRTDTGAVVKKVTEGLAASRVQAGGADSCKLQYRARSDGRLVLAVGKKEFAHADHQKIFREPWLQRYDRELEALRPHLFEFPVKFPPTYPFEENVELPTHYMKTRCPAWCDRILLSAAARLLLQPDAPRASHASRRSVTDSTDSSGRVSSSDSSPARSNSPARRNHQSSPGKALEKKGSVAELDALPLPGVAVSRKSIADPTSVQRALDARGEGEAGPGRRRLVRNQSEGSPKAEAGEARRAGEAGGAAGAPRRRADYGVIGDAACMGDHKPIYLRVLLQSERGRLPGVCRAPCALCPPPAPAPPAPLARLPTDPDLSAHRAPHPHELGSRLARAGSIPCVEITGAEHATCERIFADEIDASLLSPARHWGPYTPESAESRTPNAGPDGDRSVSPTQLRSRLDMLLSAGDPPAPTLAPAPAEPLSSAGSAKSVGGRRGGLCCLALKCYGFCRRRARRVDCRCAGGVGGCCT
ncbi:unnamed protein product, partial [Iphiclides podalirius]